MSYTLDRLNATVESVKRSAGQQAEAVFRIPVVSGAWYDVTMRLSLEVAGQLHVGQAITIELSGELP